MTEKSARIWDAPLRLFHLALLFLVAISLYTGQVGGFSEMEYHMLSGYAILALLGFRLVWGVVGSQHSRFRNFVSLKQVFPYARQMFARDSGHSSGHNPLGAISVLAMLIALLVQAVTGLFTDDDIMTEGPLTHLISTDTGDLMTSIHYYNSWVIYILVGLHIAAIVFYELYRRERLILPMITGRKSVEHDSNESASPVREIITATVVASLSAGLVYYAVNFL